ncbi:hypothetical protein LX73_0132 [Fodinibius salinus]|uniref:Uncharacterized protein n=1 Tax=Fodinibius salinus TaxID=860790 RepID=A0A5D3YP82_9BACT|nr:hypothetical protein [Fodinibius salinus]TYP94843.1 hypothetical protein LX73_0132 [Fodinibius salinus]
MSKRKISQTEKRVLEKLIFPEKYQDILEETGLLHGELRDDLINLLSFGFIEAYERSGNKISLTSFYDTDNLQDFTFQATSKGLGEIKSH